MPRADDSFIALDHS